MRTIGKVMVPSIVGGCFGLLVAWAAAATRNAVLISLARPAVFVGSTLALSCTSGDKVTRISVIVVVCLFWYVLLGCAVGCLIGLGMAGSKTVDRNPKDGGQ